MIVAIIVSIVLIFLAGVFNAKMNYIAHNGLDKESWKNKWYLTLDYSQKEKPTTFIPNYKHWYYFGLHKPKYREAFPFSSTILVFMTDNWHLYKWCTFTCLELSWTIIMIPVLDISWWYLLPIVLALKTIRGLGFTLKYDKK